MPSPALRCWCSWSSDRITPPALLGLQLIAVDPEDFPASTINSSHPYNKLTLPPPSPYPVGSLPPGAPTNCETVRLADASGNKVEDSVLISPAERAPGWR